MNNKPISHSQSLSITSESTLSLSDLEDSMAGMASIVLTDSDSEPEIFSDVEDQTACKHCSCQSPSLASHHLPAASSRHPPPIYAPLSSDKSTRPGLQEAMPATLGGLRATPSRKQKFYVVTNGQTMGVFTQWYAQFLEDGIDIDGKVPHVTSFLDDAIANAGNHLYHEVFVVRDELTALKFLLDKLRDDEVLRADF
ncbi:hypothetical protein ARMGADRAFT_1022951 [Armillaria gallica]|uniref:Uncharacterized protein n=1 Tax=Armillaria gallica TaxID=47427 RepID=A0A2H3EAS9_ARMGA|nr:hypothetical protein ARMGADRAFT_1022951 [Armillaria gallica]